MFLKSYFSYYFIIWQKMLLTWCLINSCNLGILAKYLSVHFFTSVKFCLDWLFYFRTSYSKKGSIICISVMVHKESINWIWIWIWTLRFHQTHPTTHKKNLASPSVTTLIFHSKPKLANFLVHFWPLDHCRDGPWPDPSILLTCNK